MGKKNPHLPPKTERELPPPPPKKKKLQNSLEEYAVPQTEILQLENSPT